MKKYTATLIALFIGLIAFSQNTDSLMNSSGSVRYFQSEEIEKLSELRKSINQKKCPDLLKGYRVQVFSCSGIDCLEKIEFEYQKVSKNYAEYGVAKIWDAPSHKLRVGNCRNRFAAEEIKYLMKKDYVSVFIVPDFIVSPFKIDCEK